jgi:hypothetical protein
MKPSEMFGVFVRAAGLCIVCFGLWELLGGFENVVENLRAASNGEDQTSSVTYFVDGIPAMVVGVLFFFLADGIVRLAYRHPAG